MKKKNILNKLKKVSQRTKVIIVTAFVLIVLMFTYSEFAIDMTPRVMYWPGKVNQHFDLKQKTWATDSDGYSGADIEMLEYCQKFYPKTISVEPYKEEKIDSWHSAGNVGKYEANKMSYICSSKIK